MMMSPQSEQAKDDLATALEALGELCFHECGDAEGATSFYEEAVRLREGLARDNPTKSQNQMAFALSMGKQGSVLSHLKRFAEAEPLLQHSLDVATDLSASDPNEANERELAYALARMGTLRRDSGDLDGAREYFENTCYIRRSRLEAAPSDQNRQVDMGIGLDLLGGVLATQGNDFGARSRLEEALSIFQKVAKEAPSSALVARFLWMVMYRLAFHFPSGPVQWREVVSVMEAMQRAGTLLPTDQRFLTEARLYLTAKVRPKVDDALRDLTAAPAASASEVSVGPLQ